MQAEDRPFHSLYTHGYARVSVCVPIVKIASPEFNADAIISLAHQSNEDRAVLTVFPELGLSGYSNEDLFQQDALLAGVDRALTRIARETASLQNLLLVGAPLRLDGQLFNCAVALHGGRVLGVVPKTFLPNYREYYEKRQFSSSISAVSREVRLAGTVAPFGSDLIFEASDLPGFSLFAEICEDLWVPIPPSTWGALAGATVLANLSASNITIGKAAYRRQLCAGQSGRCVAAYLYTAAGVGESTTEVAWDGHALIHENANRLAESKRFCAHEQTISADIDLDRLRQERMRLSSFNDSIALYRERLEKMRRISFKLGVPKDAAPLRRHVERFPFVPHDPTQWDQRCYEAYHIQVAGLEQRLRATNTKKMVIGVSGGLDSTHALIVCCRTADHLQLPRSHILAYTMPGFATGNHTKDYAWRLMKSLGVSATEIDIRPSCMQMFKDINHPFVRGEPVHDITFENVQAGERTSHLFRLANLHGGIVVGTGDLSELALGWCTYGVGDQMSHYNVNASIPKTLIQHLIRWEIERGQLPDETRAVLRDIIGADISPELIPQSEKETKAVQRTEESVGPYELQDFHLYFITRYGFLPSKVAFLAFHAWGDATGGDWPPGFLPENRRAYDLPTIKKWLRVFLHRFFATSQFKRSAMPNGPKVGSGGSLSPRGDWRAPSDSDATVWLDELERNVPDASAE